MERLTYRSTKFNNPVSYGACEKIKCSAKCDSCKINDLIAKLCAYEETGLEPEEIKVHEAAKYNAGYYHGDEDRCRWIEKELGPIDHLRDLLQAEKEGRMVLLPCKVGDTVWVICGKDVIYYIVDRIHILANNQVQIRAKHHVIDNVYLYPDMFGKTVFLTREEAEAALAQEGDSE